MYWSLKSRLEPLEKLKKNYGSRSWWLFWEIKHRLDRDGTFGACLFSSSSAPVGQNKQSSLTWEEYPKSVLKCIHRDREGLIRRTQSHAVWESCVWRFVSLHRGHLNERPAKVLSRLFTAARVEPQSAPVALLPYSVFSPETRMQTACTRRRQTNNDSMSYSIIVSSSSRKFDP